MLYKALKLPIRKFFLSDFYLIRIDPFLKIFRNFGVYNGSLLLFFLIESEFKKHIKLSKIDVLSKSELLDKKTSDTLFVFGAGNSLNEISDEEWSLISQHDTLGVNYFVHQKWIDVGFHYVREVDSPLRKHGQFRRSAHLQSTKGLCDLANSNSKYKNTTFFIQSDFYAETGKAILGWSFLNKNNSIFLYKAQRSGAAMTSPPKYIDEGIPRIGGAIGGGISIGAIFGWKKIVLVGVDLYNSQYFWLPEDKVRSQFVKASTDQHPTTKRGIFEIIRNWRKELNERGIQLEIYNPKSLLNSELPQFKWENRQQVHANYQA